MLEMVTKSFIGSVASRAMFLMSSQASRQAGQEAYTANTVAAIDTLQGWYNAETGLWDSTGWWNSANCLTVLADFADLGVADSSRTLDIPRTVQNTYEQAQKTSVQGVKSLSIGGMPTSTYSRAPTKRSRLARRGFDNFLNDYYDDEGWWALGLIRSYDLGVTGLGDQQYLEAANVIFEDMKNGPSPCGGIYWSKVDRYTNAIANELYLSVAASLANRMSDKQYYLDIAQGQWDWFRASGMINSRNLINDGLTSNCRNNNMTEWSYNQGVVLGGLVELYRATGNATLLDDANTIASAAIRHFDQDGVLVEGCEPDCGSDGDQFKGIFMRNLGYLNRVSPSEDYRRFILSNADSIWAADRNSRNELGVAWAGPYSDASAGTQSSALDALVAAMSVA